MYDENQLVGMFAELRKVTICFIMYVQPSICLHGINNSALTRWIFMKFGI